MDELKKRISKMLKEDTGEALCDSGGIYGRHWQKNQKRDFEKEPRLTIDVSSDGSFTITKSVYWHLVDTCSITPTSEMFEAGLKALAKKEKDAYGLGLMEEFADKLQEAGIIKAHNTFNTYNSECVLSQTLQGIILETERETYVSLQIHGGCDVRGGYTDPRVFEIEEYFHLVADATIAYKDENGKTQSIWTDDAGYHWYDEDSHKVEVKGIKADPKKMIIDGKTVEIEVN